MITRRSMLQGLGLAPIVVPALLKAAPAAAAAVSPPLPVVAPPVVPETIAAVRSKILIEWAKYEGDDFHAYEVWRHTGDPKHGVYVAEVYGGQQFVDDDVEPGQPYGYEIRSVDQFGRRSLPRPGTVRR